MPTPHQFITEEEAIRLFDITEYELIGAVPFNEIVVLEGDTVLEGDLSNTSINTLVFDGQRTSSRELFIINGNLTIKGNLDIKDEACPTFLILGDLHCDVLYSVDEFVQVTGDAHIKYAFNGIYNHGAIKIEGTTYVPYVLNSDHHSDITPCDTAVLINYQSNRDDFFDYHYYREDLIDLCVAEVFQLEEEAYKNLNEEQKEYTDFEPSIFIDLLKAGTSPFRIGGRSKQEQLIDSIEEMGKNGATADGSKKLDLKDRKLKALPLALFQIKDLETLILEKNSFNSLAEDLGNLVHLKVLNLRETGIETLPNRIADLQNLEVLNLGYCRDLKSLPESIGNLKSLKKLVLSQFTGEVPESVSKLTQLEELVLLYVRVLEDGKIVGLPDWVFKFRGLQRIHYKMEDLTEKDFNRLLDLNPGVDIVY